MAVVPRSVLERLRHVLDDRTTTLDGWLPAGRGQDFDADESGVDESDGEPDPEVVGGRHRAGSAGLSRAVLIVCVCSVILAGVLVWRAAPESQEVPSPAVGLGASVSLPPPTGTPSGSSPPVAATMLVHVVGRVNRPGLVTLPAGARVADAIRAAGGLLRRTDPGSVNLARAVTDGEQIDVGADPMAPATGVDAGSPSGSAAGNSVDLNSATVAELDGLPGVGPVLAQRIVDYRTTNGRFTSVEDLRQVSGIGEKKYADLATLVRV